MSIQEACDVKEYDELFYENMDSDARRSARIILPIVHQLIRPSSVVDFGCGNGEWLRVWNEALEVGDFAGIDGDFVDRKRLLVPQEHFIAHDLQKTIRLERTFDLVQSLEVAEHLPATVAEDFIDTLTSHGDVVLFSAATPGQMGVQHINEQPHQYWREKFESRGYRLFDPIRPEIRDQPEVSFWYRYNVLLFVKAESQPDLAESLQPTGISREAPVPDFSPLSYRVRCGLASLLPVSWSDRITHCAHWVRSRSGRQ